MDTERHRGKVAVITGAGSGIGEATAVRFAGEGAIVIACDINAAAVEATVAQILKGGGMATAVTADVASQADVERVIEAATSRHGRVDILANIAGIMDGFLPAHEVDDSTWDRVLAVNLTSIMRLCRAALPIMMAQQSGAIVNVASRAGLGGGAGGYAYTVSKHGVVGLTRSIAVMYRDAGIRCNAVCPGGVRTNIGKSSAPLSQWALERMKRPLGLAGRVAEPDEVATMLSWLASAEASNVSGAIVSDDNGWEAA